jgi:hypothetical protein
MHGMASVSTATFSWPPERLLCMPLDWYSSSTAPKDGPKSSLLASKWHFSGEFHALAASRRSSSYMHIIKTAIPSGQLCTLSTHSFGQAIAACQMLQDFDGYTLPCRIGTQVMHWFPKVCLHNCCLFVALWFHQYQVQQFSSHQWVDC